MTAQILIQIIIIGSKIYKSHSKTRLEYFNEIILLGVLYTVFCFSPWINDPQIKFRIGYFAILVVVIHLVVNITLILINSFQVVKKKCKRKFIMRRYGKQRQKSQAQLRMNHAKN